MRDFNMTKIIKKSLYHKYNISISRFLPSYSRVILIVYFFFLVGASCSRRFHHRANNFVVNGGETRKNIFFGLRSPTHIAADVVRARERDTHVHQGIPLDPAKLHVSD